MSEMKPPRSTTYDIVKLKEMESRCDRNLDHQKINSVQLEIHKFSKMFAVENTLKVWLWRVEI